MSAGPFVFSIYETNNNQRHPIRLQPETLALVLGAATNSPTTDPITSEITAYARKPKTRYGVGARLVRLRWADPQNPPAGYRPFSTVTVPILQENLFDAVTVGTTGTYLDTAVEVTSKISEEIT